MKIRREILHRLQQKKTGMNLSIPITKRVIKLHVGLFVYSYSLSIRIVVNCSYDFIFFLWRSWFIRRGTCIFFLCSFSTFIRVLLFSKTLIMYLIKCKYSTFLYILLMTSYQCWIETEDHESTAIFKTYLYNWISKLNIIFS